MSDHIAITREGPVQHAAIRRLAKKNALTNDMYIALADALTTANTDDSLRVTIISGEPGFFTAGNDINDFLSYAQEGTLPDGVLKFLKALRETDKPLILAIDGPAIGIGTTMCFHADLVYATQNALFSTPFLDLGLIPEAASSYLMPKTMGHARAFEMLVLGESYSAQAAKDAGIVNAIVDSGDLLAHVMRIATRLAAKPPTALKIARQLMRLDQEIVAKVMDKETELFAAQLKSPEAVTAFTAFLSKSKPS